jgi:serine phosphatase RsbU (regulator of sigma subunit)
MVARDTAHSTFSGLTAGGRAEPVRVLLIEDDDGDAFLVEELLAEVEAELDLLRARSLAEAKAALAGVACVLLDLGLPDTNELGGLQWLHENVPEVAIVVLTGRADEYLGAAAVRDGAQDYLVKGQVDGRLLHRVIRYAIERVRADEVQSQLREAQIYAQENARLERGLLPSPLVADPTLRVTARYSPGGQRLLLGGDFYDVVEAANGWVHAMVGDVCGHGPDEAALGVCMRVAWRTMILAGRTNSEALTTIDQLFLHERLRANLFTTLCMLSVDPARAAARIHLAGHPPPLLITPAGVRPMAVSPRPPIGVGDGTVWPSGEVTLGRSWSVLMYTDGLIEGRVGRGDARLDVSGLVKLVESVLATGAPGTGPGEPNDRLLDEVIGRARELNGGDLDDDLAVVVVGRPRDAG